MRSDLNSCLATCKTILQSAAKRPDELHISTDHLPVPVQVNRLADKHFITCKLKKCIRKACYRNLLNRLRTGTFYTAL